MVPRRLGNLAIAVLTTLPAAALAQERPTAFTGATLLSISGEPVENGTLLVHKGKILAAGAADQVEVPVGAERVDVKGKTIMPGLVDTHSHIGGGGGGDRSAPIQPDVRIFDSINPLDSGFMRARAGGLTTLNVMPGSGHLMSGQTVYLKLRDEARTIDDMFIRADDGWIMGGMKMANGTNPLGEPPFPGTRGKSAALVRQHYIKAQEYREKQRRATTQPATGSTTRPSTGPTTRSARRPVTRS